MTRKHTYTYTYVDGLKVDRVPYMAERTTSYQIAGGFNNAVYWFASVYPDCTLIALRKEVEQVPPRADQL